MEFSLNLLSIIIFYGLILYVVIKNRKKIEFHKLYLLYKTKHGIKLLDRLSKYRFWKYWAYVGIPVGLIGMVVILSLLLSKVIDLFRGVVIEQGVQLLLPWTSSGSAGPFMFMPFWIFIICIAVVVLVHEGAHGIVSQAHNLKLQSTGLGMFTIIPLAFVEPDEKQLEKSSLATQLSVFAAGPFANICTGFFALLVSIFFLIPAAANVVEPSGLEITNVVIDFPAANAGIVPGDKIIAINGEETLGVDAFVDEIIKIDPGEDATFLLQDREVLLTVAENPAELGKPYIGVSFKEALQPKSDTRLGNLSADILLFLINLFSWLWVLNIGIGLVNLLPLGPVDGGRMTLVLSHKFIKNQTAARLVWLSISVIALAALLLNLISPFLLSIF